MKVLCISKWAKAPSPEERDAILPKERHYRDWLLVRARLRDFPG